MCASMVLGVGQLSQFRSYVSYNNIRIIAFARNQISEHTTPSSWPCELQYLRNQSPHAFLLYRLEAFGESEEKFQKAIELKPQESE